MLKRKHASARGALIERCKEASDSRVEIDHKLTSGVSLVEHFSGSFC